MCAEDLLAAGANCIPTFAATCIAEGLLENAECVECVADFDFSSLIPNPFGWAKQKIEEEFICISTSTLTVAPSQKYFEIENS